MDKMPSLNNPDFNSQTANHGVSLASRTYDLFIIGGGINGAGIAADAAGRGLDVMLCEQHDLASATSSASSKLIHGGLRYLEYYEFRLVKEALAERETLLRIAPHLVQPMRFTLPHQPHLRPAWMIRCGLFLYDHLAKRDLLAGSNGVRFGTNSPLKANLKRGFAYSDCWVDDARLVVTNALAARDHGARIAVGTRCIGAKRSEDGKRWEIQLETVSSGQRETIFAKGLVNAAGPWVAKLFGTALSEPAPRGIRLIKGSHIVVPRMHEGDGAFILQNNDRRIVFVLPFQEDFSLIGTTDKEYRGNPTDVAIDDEEIDYLLGVVNAHFVKQITRADIRHTFSGVRPLCDDESSDPSAVTRDYTLDISEDLEQAPLLSVFGGKITTYRKLAESALGKLAPWYPQMGPRWTGSTALPGSQRVMRHQEDIRALLTATYPQLPAAMIRRFSRSYGTLAIKFLGKAQTTQELGQHFGSDLYQAEVNYLIEQEWARHANDILWRRTKQGLHLNDEQKTQLQDYVACKLGQKTLAAYPSSAQAS